METVLKRSELTRATEATRAEAVDADALLMLRFKDGDLEAFELLFARHARALVNFTFRFVRNRQVAEELAQEVFLKVHDAAGGYQAGARFTTWLYRIATNVCLNEIRKPGFRARHESLDATLPGDPEPRHLNIRDSSVREPDYELERRAVSMALRRSLERLPEKQRIAFVLNKFQELSYADVAATMRTSEKAVKSLIHRAKETLAERLKPLLSGLVVK